jgi:hypothetical protein
MEPYKITNQNELTGDYNKPVNEDINGFINTLRRELYSGRKLTFKQFLQKSENILDKL